MQFIVVTKDIILKFEFINKIQFLAVQAQI